MLKKVIYIHIYNISFDFGLLDEDIKVFVSLFKANTLIKSYDILYLEFF